MIAHALTHSLSDSHAHKKSGGKTCPPLPISDYGLTETTNQNYTEIVLYLPNGSYSFTVHPDVGFFTPTYGSVNVAGSNTTVPVRYAGTSCTTATITSLISHLEWE
jgi:hypothetical protein